VSLVKEPEKPEV